MYRRLYDNFVLQGTRLGLTYMYSVWDSLRKRFKLGGQKQNILKEEEAPIHVSRGVWGRSPVSVRLHKVASEGHFD